VVLKREDEDHLRLLSIFHYIVAAMQGLFSLFPLLHFFMGAAMVFAPEKLGGSGKGGPPPDLVGWFFMAFAGGFIVLGLSVATCVAFAGRFLARRKHYLFCLVVAGVTAVMCMPFGTILGVFTIIVLMRPSVKEAFGYPGVAEQ
jgi:hypothetical protein